jgi:superfamily II DNA or RNA helicase
MARTIRLRKWQKAALDAFTARPGSDFLAVATPGAGKSMFALAAARQEMARRPQRLIIVAPTQHLRVQWADAAESLDLHLETSWSAADGGLPRDVHGLVTTYQQVATSAAALAEIARDAFVILDEVHHAGYERAWGESVRLAFAASATRLSLSGTPFRSDTLAIPFVNYDSEGLATADVEYGYGNALTDGGVVRPVHFPRLDGEMEWIGSDGLQTSASFADALDSVASAQRLRTALSAEGDWLPHVLSKAHHQLMSVRQTHPDAAGLVIAIDQAHAKDIASIFREQLKVPAVVAVSEDADASRKISAFATDTAPWIIAVRMISEGVDIPRLRVGVFATTTTTELFFRQAVGRIVRWIRGLGPQPGYMFVPDDPRLRRHVLTIAEQRRHSLRKRDENGEIVEADPTDPAALDEVPTGERDEQQLSLFAALSARPIGEASSLTPADIGLHVAMDDGDSAGLDLELIDVPHLRPPEAAAGLSPRERRRILREANQNAVRELSRVTGHGHARVNADLNALVGIRSIQEATLDELADRRMKAEAWLARTPLRRGA